MPQLSLIQSLTVLHSVRTNHQVVIPTMGAAREWMTLGTHPLDFIYAPSAMGQAPLLGLGIALAQPDKQVIVINGDGCMLMNLGCLVTITAAAPPNFVLIVCDNSVYEVTGRQWTAAADPARPGSPPVDFCQIARGSGFQQVCRFDRLNSWEAAVRDVLAERGPTFVLLKVEPVPGGAVPKSPSPPKQRAMDFARAVHASAQS
ncbi:MAG TPA: thiamine pyrophosphate-dependent enzyme [Planctomycetaceae bacterium]|nr:thiamine pyrophosphate-dependent enzyme [Planctomycetaceae bacterium]